MIAVGSDGYNAAETLAYAPSSITIRRRLLSLYRSQMRINLPKIDGHIRNAARELARNASTGIDILWEKANCSKPGPIQVIDMFSGCGGMSAGFAICNSLLPAYRLVAALDIDKAANRTYEKNLGLRPFTEDISSLRAAPRRLNRLLERAGYDFSKPSILIGCAPCQGFSSHRNDRGTSDLRNSLFLDFARIAARIKPAAIVIENVPELLTNRYWSIAAAAMTVLRRSGYFVHVAVHNLAEFGLPQERFRAVILAMPHAFASPQGFLNRASFKTVRDSIGSLPPISAGLRDANDPMHYSAGHKSSTIDTIRAVPKNGGSRPQNVGPRCLERARQKNGRAVYEDVYGRLWWDRPAITITAYARNPASGRYVHPEQDRGLTVREAALLQGFPRKYHFEGTLDEKFRQIGNAVPPMFSAYLATYLLGELSSPPASKFDPGISQDVGPSFSRLIAALKAGHREDITCVR